MADQDKATKGSDCFAECRQLFDDCMAMAQTDADKAACAADFKTCVSYCPDQFAERDCYTACAAAYDTCMATAGSDAEKAACSAKYQLCLANC
jgi:hypothetical protein